MQIDSLSRFFDTADLTIEHPVNPEGFLFTYYPSENPRGLHYHNFLEIGYCESGTGIFIIDGEIVPFNGKCVSIIYDGQVHIAKSINPDKSLWHFLYIDVEKLFFDSNLARLKALKYADHQSYSFPNIIRYEDDPILYHLVSQILAEAANAREDFLQVLKGLVYALLTLHGRYMVKTMPCSDIREKNYLLEELGDVLTYISRHYTENITIEDLCSVSNMSKSTLQRKMIACVGCAPLQYIQHLRMSHAAVLLDDKTIPISEVAIRSGYNSISSFNRTFQNTYGVSPKEWRKQQDRPPPPPPPSR